MVTDNKNNDIETSAADDDVIAIAKPAENESDEPEVIALAQPAETSAENGFTSLRS